jgi:hypothetical protein
MDLDPDLFQVELFADGVNGEPPAIFKMNRETKSEATTGGLIYNVSVPSVRTASDYTARVITGIPGISFRLKLL